MGKETVIRTSRMHRRGRCHPWHDWTLIVRQEHGDWGSVQALIAFGTIDYRLDVSGMTAAEAHELICHRQASWSRMERTDGLVTLGDIRLTHPEAAAIQQGACPVQVLLPPVRVRILTKEELMR